jgi:hypothetical protein
MVSEVAWLYTLPIADHVPTKAARKLAAFLLFYPTPSIAGTHEEKDLT